MKPKTLVLLAVAGCCGLVAMLGVQQAMQHGPAPAKIPHVKVLVALESIETGMKITTDNTTFRELPVDSAPEDAVLLPEEFLDRAARVPFMAGDIVRKSKLTEKGEWGKSVAIPTGMRVISIPVDDTHTISGLLRPGDRVDVLVTYQGRGHGGSQISKTKTLLEYVEVFSMDDHTVSRLDEDSTNSRAKNVALLLTPEQAGFVILAQRKGSLSLSWRRRSDDELAQTKDIDEKLMEELEGTVGLSEGGSFHSRNRGFSEEDYTQSPFSEQTPQQFLDQTAADATAAPKVTVAQAPTGLMWKVEIYNGNETLSQEFELPVEKVAADQKLLPEEIDSPEKMEQTLLKLK